MQHTLTGAVHRNETPQNEFNRPAFAVFDNARSHNMLRQAVFCDALKVDTMCYARPLADGFIA